MRVPLQGLPFVCTGRHDVVAAAADFLEALGADVIRVEEIHGPEHAAAIAALEPIGALDVTRRFHDPPFPVVLVAPVDAEAAWAASGALALTGDADGPPLMCGPDVAVRLLGAGAVVQLLAACRAVPLALDPLALLGERAAIAGFVRHGATSVGQHAHLVATADGWVAINLARPEDLAALPALLDGAIHEDTPWDVVRATIAATSGAELDERAALLGFPLGVVPKSGHAPTPRSPYVFDATAGERPATRRLRIATGEVALPAPRVPLVVDLSSLWAGPLAASLLGACGARVIKVEGVRRPDGARRGPSAFFDVLNHGKECLAIDFADTDDVALLRSLCIEADVVIEGSRPRVMQGVGIDPGRLARDSATTWISITGHGRNGDDAARVAFGDDAAAAAGLVVAEPPRFVADAVADPIAGLFAAAVGLASLVGHRGQLVDVSLRRAAAYARGDAQDMVGRPFTGDVAPPRARCAPGPAAAHGAHSAALRAEFGPPSTITT